MIDPVLVRFLQSIARGPSQLNLINELITNNFEIPIKPKMTPIKDSRPVELLYYGETMLGGKSWVGLKKRLIASGFIVIRDKDYTKITLKPGLNERAA